MFGNAMEIHLRTSFIPGCLLVILIQGCSLTTQPVEKSRLGKSSSSAEMEALIEQPGPVQLITVNSVEWAVPLAGLLNLNSPAAKQAGLKDRDEPIQVYAHILKHPKYGSFLVDTGVSKKLLDDPGKEGVSWLILKGMPVEKMRLKKGTAEILQDVDGKLAGVFFTHMHIDHISGMPDIPNDAPLYIGATESTEKVWMNMLVQGTNDQLLKNKQALQEWQFQPDPQSRFEGIVDIFSDGSVYAISVPGHTPGSVAFLVRTTNGPVLLTGDTCHTRWGWENTVEPGDYTQDQERNLQNLKRLKGLVAAHPQIEVRLGHQH
jgi:N-acyl homoserine lactone hydrolase